MAGIPLVFYPSGLYVRDAARPGYIPVIIILYCVLFRTGPVYGEDLPADGIATAAAISGIGPRQPGNFGSGRTGRFRGHIIAGVENCLAYTIDRKRRMDGGAWAALLQ